MSSDNLHATLEAVNTALGHLAAALDKGGFGAGSRSYTQMAEIVIGQRLWAVEHGIDTFDDRFHRVAILAAEVHRQLLPYVEAMDRLRMLPALAPQDNSFAPESAEAKVLAVIDAADRPQSLTQLRNAVGMPSSQMRVLLASMVDRGLLSASSSGSRTRYGVAP
ncbi:helix-turn-helix domain-containing protein [Nocardia amamiensis]|uniref:helix-turn-helix domain-containing protein n=1 Tax=Nocardia amamiensis TaxID=404578 RepID=UPI000833C3A6|nr:helix-turn-helix domain-containing protein [Nocardia amamiensis]